MEEKEKKERVMCLIGHVSNFDWGNGQNGGKEMEVSFSLLFINTYVFFSFNKSIIVNMGNIENKILTLDLN